ncbi:MAG: glycosyltransferase family 4 protein [Bacteroidales bacterium]|jgi:hypothetical protein|nr:glycosyltransferase family 4 protein [Bacteroidales bacterium]MCI2146350.1 glycosyltransferase family 4 protein [Bacteroidales bacterium]
MKLLFIQYKKSGDVLEGGGHGAERNLAHIRKALGEGNVEEMHIHDDTVGRSKWSYVTGMFHFFGNYFFGLTPRRVRDIVRHACDGKFDYVFIDRSIFGKIARGLKEAGYKGCIITSFQNVEKEYFKAKISPWAPWRPIVVHCADVNDRLSCRYSDKMVVLNRRDEDSFYNLYGRHADAFIPVTFRDKLGAAAFRSVALTSPKPLCIFLGSYFRANNRGIEWFVRNVYQYVEIRMRIVGKGMGRLRCAPWMKPDIEIMSDVPDLGPVFDEADIMVLPIFDGSGMKVKTCESLMHGKNIIGTREAFEGYDLDYDRVGALCNTPTEFIKAINGFATHPRPRFNAYSREIFLEKYSDDVADALFSELLS